MSAYKYDIINEIDITNSNKIYHSHRCGDFIILDSYIDKFNKTTMYYIKFIDTGYETVAQRQHVKRGNVKDPYSVTALMYGVGYLGEPDKSVIYYELEYSRWKNIISRCYNTNDDRYYTYGSIGVTVDTRWWCFANFLEDIQHLHNYDKHIKFPNYYQLDKDYLQMHIPPEKRIYSKDTCIWLDARSNNLQRNCINDFNRVYRPYHGVTVSGNVCHATIKINGKEIILGTFDQKDTVVAANVYNNYYHLHFNNDLLINNVPYMSPEETIKYDIKPKEMCKIIK